MERHGWRILFHPELVRQLSKLEEVRERARRNDPHGFASNANVKSLQAVNRAMLEAIPQDPSRAEYRQEKTRGKGYQHWRRAKIGRQESAQGAPAGRLRHDPPRIQPTPP